MSKLGFDKLLSSFSNLEREFLTKGVKLAQREFEHNFESESNSESYETWNDVVRDVPPPILDVTGKLKNEATTNIPILSKGKAVLTINPIDERGREYASYHQDGENQYRSKEEFQREFVTQSEELTQKQVNLLEREADKFFSK